MNAPQPATPPIRALIAPVTPLQQNCTIVWCAKTLKAAIIEELDGLAKLDRAQLLEQRRAKFLAIG